MIYSVPTKDNKNEVLLDNIFDENMTFGDIYKFERNGKTILSLTDNPPRDAQQVRDFSLTLAVTYSKISPESAEEGEDLDHGWVDIEGSEHSLKNGTLPGNGKRTDGYDHIVTPEEAEFLAEQYEISGDRDMGSGDFRWLGSFKDQNFQDGTETYFSLHCKAASADGIDLDEQKMLAVVATRLPGAKMQNVTILGDEEFQKIAGISIENERKNTMNENVIRDYHEKITSFRSEEVVGRISLVLDETDRLRISMTPGEPEELSEGEGLVSTFSYWNEDYDNSLCSKAMSADKFIDNVKEKIEEIKEERSQETERARNNDLKKEQAEELGKSKNRGR